MAAPCYAIQGRYIGLTRLAYLEWNMTFLATYENGRICHFPRKSLLGKFASVGEWRIRRDEERRGWTERDGTGRKVTGRHGEGRDRKERDGTGWIETEMDGAGEGRDRTEELDGRERDRTG